MSTADLGPGGTIRWPRQSHPGALTPAGQERTPWLTSWAGATFEQGILSVLPMLEGPCTATSLPGEHLFQASGMGCRHLEANRGVQIYGVFLRNSRQECPAILPVVNVARNSPRELRPLSRSGAG